MEGELEEAIEMAPLQQKHRVHISVSDELAVTFVTSVFPASSLARLTPLEMDANPTLSYVTLLQYEKNEHLPHFRRDAFFSLHPWQVLLPSSSVEYWWTWSLNRSNSVSVMGIT
jgi:hypothetical protein